MRTKYFKRTSMSEEGKKHLNTLAGLSLESTEKILGWFEERDFYPRLDSDDRQEIAQLTGESGGTVQEVVSILQLFIDRIIDHDEDVEAFYADVKDLKIVEDGVGYATLDKVFSRLNRIVGKFRLYRRCATTESYGMPVLSFSTMSAVIKPVFSRRFRYGEDSLEAYTPKPIGFCVVAQVDLEKDSPHDRFCFQLNEDGFDRLITDLLALQAQMKVAKEEAERLNQQLKRGAK